MLDILYEESHFLLIDKPSGMFSQSAPGIENVQETLVRQLAERDNHAGNPFIGLPHRLDRGTSGVMLLAKNQRSLKRFGEQFQSRKISKYYLAVCHGTLPAGVQTWTDYVRKIPEKPLAEISSADVPDAREATLSAVCLGSTAEAARLNTDAGTSTSSERSSIALVELHTGRMHQIRIQFASRGFPVVGDWSYGSEVRFGPLDGESLRQCFALHALRIEIRHPQTGKLMAFTAGIPPLWSTLSPEIVAAAQRIVACSRRTSDRAWLGVGAAVEQESN